jgi:hypothetical protein
VAFETIADDEEPQNGDEGSEPIDTAEDAGSRMWETDDDDAEEGTLDDGPDDLASDESRRDRQGYWGG